MGHIGTLAVNPALYPKLGYDPVRDFAPVAWVARVPNILAIHPSVPARTLAEFVALARSRPGALNYSSGGNGSAAHLTMEVLKLATTMPLVHIPYRGAAPAVADVIAGQVQAVFTGAPALLPHVKAGKLRALAVSSPKRIPALPEVPTVAESGVPGTRGFEADQWYGLVAPAGTPAAAVQLLNQQVNRALASAEVQARLAGEGAEPTPASPEAYGRLIASELRRWAPVVKAANIQPD
jgi:tripartite-type tricarboxylate transporter receptor subunit TctC